MVKFSIITPVLNGGRFIRETVESVLGQRGDFELEYIIRDGGSIDNTLRILEDYDHRCVIVSENDGSPQEAINAGMAMASGDILAWLNADDLYEKGALARVARSFALHRDNHWCYGRCRIIDEAGTEIRKPITWYKNLLGLSFSRNVLLCENYINQPATFWKRELWDQIGPLDTHLKAAFDYQLWLEMSRRSDAISIPAYLAKFRRHASSISENHFQTQFSEELDVAMKHGTNLHLLIHWANVQKICQIYRILGRRP